MKRLNIVRVVGSAHRHYKTCQSANHDACNGDIIWRCAECEKSLCCAEGTTDKPELCDDCWAKSEGEVQP